jgi:hypothetical protein
MISLFKDYAITEVRSVIDGSELAQEFEALS